MILALLLFILSRPDPALTPGIVRTLTKSAICATHWGKDRRAVTLAMRKAVLQRYGIAWSEHVRFEIDHLVPRELGGADDLFNLWPQLWAEARVKDRRENQLHRFVCAGLVPLEDAQDEMRTWGR